MVRPLRPLRVVPGAAAPPLRVIPGGAGAPSGLAGGDARAGGHGHGDGGIPADGEALADGEVLTTIRPLPEAASAPTPLPLPGAARGTVPGSARRALPAPVARRGPLPADRRAAGRRRVVAATLVLLLLAALVVTGRMIAEQPRAATAPTAPATTASPGSVAPVRPSAVVATVATDGFSSGMAVGAGALWVAGSDEVRRIDPTTNTVAARIPVGPTGSGPAAVAVGAGAVWMPVAVPGALWGVDPDSDKVTTRISLGGPLRGAISVSATRDTVWVACCGESSTTAHTAGGRLLRVDPIRKRVVADIALPASPVAVAADPSGAWVATAGGQVLMVSPKRNRVVATIAAGGPLGFTQTIAVGAGGVWLADPFDEQIVRIDPRTRRVTARIPAGAVTTLAATGNAVWALSSLGLVRVDPIQDRVTAVDAEPELRRARLVAADDAAVWTAAWSSVSRIDPDLVTP